MGVTKGAEVGRMVDIKTFADVYDMRSSVVYGIAARVTRSRTAADDITQEVFVRLWTHSHQFDPERGTLRNWLCMTAHSLAVGWVRREVARSERLERAACRNGGLGPTRDASYAVDERLAADHEAEVVNEALQRLTDLQREALSLVYFEGLTHCEVASVLDIPLGTAKTRIRGGLRRLGTELVAKTLVSEGR